MPAAVTVASAAKTTHDHRAGRKPAVTAAGLARWPWAENTALLIAMAKTVPSRCAIWLMPDALPISGSATALRTAVGTVGRAIEMPMPATSRASVISIQLVLSEPRAATQVKPSACRVRPVTITGRRPMRSETAPASGETSIGVAKNGSRRAPAATGE